MKTSGVIQGMQILQKYYDDEQYNCSAEHDMIYMHATPRPVSSEDRIILKELGWDQENVGEDEYDQDEPWYCNV